MSLFSLNPCNQKLTDIHSGMVNTADDTSQRTLSDPLYDAPPGSDIQLGQPNLNYDPDSGSFITVTNGAGANAPSENLGFYFGGFYNANGTAYDYFKPPTDKSTWFITVTMDDLGHAQWNKAPLGEDTPWRAEAGLVWVPASTHGVLIAIGGVVKPADLNAEVSSDNTTQSMTFLTEFPVYDIGTSKWHLQALNPNSQVPPTPLAQFCTVVATDQTDASHHEIFVYGGWDSNLGDAQGDVWILSVPSFTWIKAEPTGRAGAIRTGHVCVQPYPDQMIVIGGTAPFETPPAWNNTVDVFNLNTLEWTGTYDPEVYANYTPHANVLNVVKATPTASGMSTQVAGWFAATYTGNIRSFGPYKAEVTSTPSSTSSHSPIPTHHSNRDWVVPVAVTVPVVVVAAFLAGLIFMCCRRRQGQNRQQTAASQADHSRKSWIVPWLWSTSSAGHPKDIGTDSSVTEVEPRSPPQMMQVNPHELEGGYFPASDTGNTRERWSSSTQVRSPRYGYAGPVEGMDTEVHEVHGSPRTNKPDNINYDFRNMALYPPSVVSGGHPGTIPSSSVSRVENDSNTPASPHTASVGIASSGFTPITEGQVVLGDDHLSATSRAISPVDLRRERPSKHERNLSDVSSAPSLPSPNENQSPLPVRPGQTRSLSGEDDQGGEDPGTHTM